MPKIRTRKTVKKRFAFTKRGKVLRRKAMQDHFNAKDSGNKVRTKRQDVLVENKIKKNIKKLVPYR
ncbi:50S ribosomal protein L35 [bacterium (Candidatus Torokbacteria) CG_4_10_14_0_2_um_filter_35_8]|nr:MAG: 50S ribosomal protein L35 [bacterium (Candidatus Torokbacteria) CG_4_10_14_0_2_um_filter_35_8]